MKDIKKELKFEIYKKYTRLIFGNVDLQMTTSFKEYRFKNPQSLICLNSEIYYNNELIWYGDIDLTKDISKIKKLVDKLQGVVQIYNSGEFKNKVSPLIEVDKLHSQTLRDEEKKFYEFDLVLGAFVKTISNELPERSNGIYNRNKYTHEIEIPSFENFDYKNDKVSPFDFLYDEILKKMNLNLKDVIIDSSKMIINYESLDDLLLVFEEWLLKSKTVAGRTYELKERIDFARKNISPLVFEGSVKGPEWVKENTIYIQESFYEKK